MKGMELSQNFFEETAKPLFEKELPQFLEKGAFGLVGEGSECFGFDDEFSKDHDFGAGFCIWLLCEEWKTWLNPVEDVLEKLPLTYEGYPVRMAKNLRMGRLGPFSVERFFEIFIGTRNIPRTWQEWINIPEHFLAVCTNGKIFLDKPQRFSAVRQALLDFYPEDVRLKKIAARCAVMAQAGQYNALRSLQRDEKGAVLFSVNNFCNAAISLTFLLNKQYMPYYKWAHHAVQFLPVLGSITYSTVQQLSQAALSQPQSADTVFEIIETHCQETRMVLNEMGLTQSTDNWMMNQAHEIQAQISILELRAMSILQDSLTHCISR